MSKSKKSGIFFLGLIWLGSFFSFLYAQTDYLLGDSDGDGAVSIVDALLAAQYYVGQDPPGFNPEAADVDCNEAVNIVDSLLIAQYYVGIRTFFPCDGPSPTPGGSPDDESLVRWGLGLPLEEYHSLERDYDWYLDQYASGPFSSTNCGPATVTMALKWFDEFFTGTIEEARAVYRPEGGWWYTIDITNYLDLYDVPNNVIFVEENPGILTGQLRAGHLLILCLSMEYIRENPADAEHTHAFYSGLTGHFLAVKGYIITDGVLYFEVYDPYSLNHTYPAPEAGWPKGKNRYYAWEDLYPAVTNWWSYAVVVGAEAPAAATPGARLNTGLVDPLAINHMPGGVHVPESSIPGEGDG